jgi:predicted ATPase/class 3 adenylate cyclase/DNA-binding CsgD family transcriptional regulator
MTDLPAGTITFLFTDVEASTRLLGEHPAAYRAAVRRHHDLLRHAVESQGGVVFETVGDAVYAAFTDAAAAVAAAVQGQRALQQEPWREVGEVRVRMGLHTGAVEREGDHYFGVPLYRCARIMAAAHGGQVVLSEATASLVRDALPAGVSLRELGEHRLRDLARPERVCQLVVSGLPADFPRLRTLDARPHNLPAQRTPLVGRGREVAAIQHLLLRDGVRLVTLTGPGGSGKTRLALQTAAELLDHFVDGAVFVDLAPIADPALMASTVAFALGLREAGQRSAPDLVREHLRDKRLLLVLDNFEQVLPAADLVADLLAACPRLKVLVTSRAVLRLYGEHDYPVPPLTLPEVRDPALPEPVERLARYEAVALFVERAQAASPSFALTTEVAPAVAEICRRLDGLPLAIELAAARVRLLPPPAMLARLGRDRGQTSLHLLTGGARDLPARQQTLRNTIEWSYHLLDPNEQALLRRLCVFAGGCTLEAAEAVAGGHGASAGHSSPHSVERLLPASGGASLDVLAGIESLVNKSLLRPLGGGDGEPRFGMFDTIREYGQEQLASGGEAEALRDRHAAYFLTLAEAAAAGISPSRAWVPGPECNSWLDRLEPEHVNFREALRWLLTRGDPPAAVRLASALIWFWWLRGHAGEGRRWLDEALAARVDAEAVPFDPSGPRRQAAADRACALCYAGLLAYYQSDYREAALLSGRGLALYRDLRDKEGVATALLTLASVSRNGGDYFTARAMHEEAIALLRETDDPWGTANHLVFLGRVYFMQGEHEAARATAEKGLALSRRLGIAWDTAYALFILGSVAQAEGDDPTARARYEEALALFRGLADRRGLSRPLRALGTLALQRRDLEAARAAFRESLTLATELGDRWAVAETLEGLAGVAAAEARPERTARLLGAADALRCVIGTPLPPVSRIAHERGLAAVRAALGEPAFSAVWAEGQAMTPEQALAAADRLPPPSPPAPLPVAAPVGPSPPLAQSALRAAIPDGYPAGLTAREVDVLRLVAQGLTNAHIAQRLVVSRLTVNAHLRSIYGKLDVTSRTAAARYALEHGLA